MGLASVAVVLRPRDRWLPPALRRDPGGAARPTPGYEDDDAGADGVDPAGVSAALPHLLGDRPHPVEAAEEDRKPGVCLHRLGSHRVCTH